MSEQKKKEDAQTEKDRERLHNTRYLLRQYRRIAYSVKMSEEDLGEKMEAEYGTALKTFRSNAEKLNIDLSGTSSESYARSLCRSKCMLKIIDHALEVVKGDPDLGELLYLILYYTYFTPVKLPNREAILLKLSADGYDMSPVTYHSYQQMAIEAMDGVLWGYTAADAVKIVDRFFPEETESAGPNRR